MNRMNRNLPAAGHRATWLVVFPPALGDSILSFPIVDRVRAADPGIEVVIAALPHLQALLKGIEGLAEVFTYDELAGDCGGRHFEWVIDLSGFEYHKKMGERRNFDNAIYRTFAQWDRIVVRSPEGERDVPDPIYARSSNDPEFLSRLAVWLHESATLLAHALGEDPLRWLSECPMPTLRWSSTALHSGDAVAPAEEIVFLPCGTWERQKWPEDHWIGLADRLMGDGYTVTVVLGPLEHAGYARLRTSVSRTVISSELVELACEIARGSVIVGHDCGPMHLSAAMGKTCLAILGPTNPYKWYWYRNHRQLFIQTRDAFAAGQAARWKVDRTARWEDWPSEQEAYAKLLELL